VSGNQQAKPVPELGAGRRRVFWLVALATPVVFALSVEGLVRLLVGASISDDLKLSIVDVPPFLEPERIDGELHYRVSHDELYSGRNIVFAAEKAPGTVRIFCLGGSASAGWPHPQHESHSAYLQQALQRALPNRAVEVINLSAHAYAAYRVRLIFDKAIEFDPDLIVLYTGNNEFLEKRSYLPTRDAITPILRAANRLAAFRLARSWIIRLAFPENSLSGSRRQHVAYEQWSKVKRIALDLRADPYQLLQVVDHYSAAVESMVRKAGRRGLPVILVTVPVNLRDWHPNVSHNGLSGRELEQWQTAFRAGRGALLRGDTDAALGSFQRAIAMEPLHAESHFYLARAFEKNGDSELALEHYRRASDLDYNPFRAISAFNAALRSIAERNPHAHLADAEGAFRRASAPHAPGFDLFLDYVHPTREGNLRIAQTVFDAILRRGLLGNPPRAARFLPAPSRRYDETRDVRLQRVLLLLFGMMHQYESIVEKARHYSAQPEADLPFAQLVLQVFSDTLELDRKRVLGIAVDPAEEERIDANLERFYREQYPAPN
jgi:tetratricopeptide (TPR) repeat protein